MQVDLRENHHRGRTKPSHRTKTDRRNDEEEQQEEEEEEEEREGEGEEEDEEEEEEEEADETEKRATRRGSSKRGGAASVRRRRQSSPPSSPSASSPSTPTVARGRKRGRRAGGATPSSSTSRSSSRRGKAGGGREEDVPSAEEESFTDLWRQLARSPTSTVKSIARAFLDSYEAANQGGKFRLQAELINLTLEVAGGVGGLTVTEVRGLNEEVDVVELREKCEDQAMLVQGEPPLQKVRKLETRLRELFHRLYSDGGVELLVDDRFFNAVLPSFISVFSASAVRTFRFALSVAYQGLMAGLIDAALEVEKRTVTAEAQLAAATARKSKASAALSAQLTESISELTAALELLHSLLKKLFASVFCHRYRDVDAELRALYLSSLSSWMSSYPSFFVLDSYLKYLGWTLFDKAAVVRRASLGGLLRLYSSADVDLFKRLDAFTQRFLRRLEEMCEDVDGHVSGLAIQVLAVLLRLGVLKEEEATHVPVLLWDEDSAVRKSAAQFVVADMFGDKEQTGEEGREGEDGGQGGRQRGRRGADEGTCQKHEDDLLQLLLLFQRYCPLVTAKSGRVEGGGSGSKKRRRGQKEVDGESQGREVPHLRHLLVHQGRLTELRGDEYQHAMEVMVEGLLPHLSALQDWPSIARLLLTGETAGEEGQAKGKKKKKAGGGGGGAASEGPLTSELRLFLCHLLVAAAKSVTKAAVDKGGGGKDSQGEQKERHKAAVERRREAAMGVSLFLIEQLPLLLSTHLSSSSHLTVLLQLLSVLDWAQFAQHRQRSQFSALVVVMKKMMTSQVDWPVLRECGLGWKRLVKDNDSYEEEAAHAVEEVSVEWREALRKEWQSLAEGGSQEEGRAAVEWLEDEDRALTLLALVKRILALTRALHLPDLSYSSPHLHSIFHQLLPAVADKAHQGGSLLQHELLHSLLHLLYIDIVWGFCALDRQKPSRAAMERLIIQRNDLCSVLHRLLEHSSSFALKDAAFEMTSDLFVLFSVKLQGGTLTDLVLNRERAQPLSAAFAEHFQLMMDGEQGKERWEEQRQREAVSGGGSEEAVDEELRVSELLADLRVEALTAAGKVLCFDQPRPGPTTSSQSFTSPPPPRHVQLTCHFLSHFISDHPEVVALIKHSMHVMRDLHFAGFLQAQRLTLIHLYEHHADDEPMKALSHKFALFHGVQHPSLLPLLRSSLGFAVAEPPTRLSFLDLLLPFVSRSSRTDADALFEALQTLKPQLLEAKKGDSRAVRREEADSWAALDRLEEALAKKRGKANATAKRSVERLEGEEGEGGGEEEEEEEPSLLLTPSSRTSTSTPVRRVAPRSAGSERSGRSILSLGLSPVREVEEEEAKGGTSGGGRPGKRSRAQRDREEDKEEEVDEGEQKEGDVDGGEVEASDGTGEVEEAEEAEEESRGSRKRINRGRTRKATPTRGRSRRGRR